MDTAVLVEDLRIDGESFIDHLKRKPFDVSVAFWVLTTEEQQWFLYIATPEVARKGLAGAYRQAFSELARCGVQWLSQSDIKLISNDDPAAIEAIKYRRRLLTKYGGRKLGNMIIEEAYIYPE